MASSPSGFELIIRGAQVEIRHDGRHAATLRSRAAEKFLDNVERLHPQLVMARATGNYKRGNERRT
jgi:thymidylate synthase ThyX